MTENETDTPTEFTDGTSSLVAAATYEPGQEVMTVTLHAKPEDRTFRYGGVPALVWQEFYQATSRGAYFNQFIRPMFNGVAVE